MSRELSEAGDVIYDLEICDAEVGTMKAECDKHFGVMEYCREKYDFMMEYIADRNLTENLSGRLASASPK